MGYYKKLVLVPDSKSWDGLWVKGFPLGDGRYATTRAYSCWNRIEQRCMEGSAVQIRARTFCGNKNIFSNFQDFAEWCQTQAGYNNKDPGGKYWQLDKDIIEPFNKVYAPENCCFVPQRVNSLLVYKSASRGDFPLGIFLDKRRLQYAARCRDYNSRVKWLGYFDDPFCAHRAWQLAKIQVFRQVAEDYKFLNSKVYDGLNKHADYFQQDYDNGRETVR